jgi:hypothetical protein
MGFKEIGWEGMNRLDLAKDRDKWQVVMNTVINLHVA